MRTMSITAMRRKKHRTFNLSGIWHDVLGKPEVTGIWLVYGAEKNGKTWLALLLAQMLSGHEKLLYVSAEEGDDKTFVDACDRAGIEESPRLRFSPYAPIEDIDAFISRQRAAKVIFIDNLVIYSDELTKAGFNQLVKKHSNKLFVVLGHEERNDPYPALARHARKLAKIYFHVKGLKVFVGGRCPGGELWIDETKGQLYHGTDES